MSDDDDGPDELSGSSSDEDAGPAELSGSESGDDAGPAELSGSDSEDGGDDTQESTLSTLESAFADIGIERTVESGAVLLAQGAPSSSIFYVRSGLVDVKVAKEDLLSGESSSLLVATRTTGSVLGEIGFLLNNDASASLIAQGEGGVVVREVAHDQLIAMVTSEPGLAGKFFKFLAQDLSARVLEISLKFRQGVGTTSAPPPQGGRSRTRTVAEQMLSEEAARAQFGLGSREKLVGAFPCTVAFEEGGTRVSESGLVGAVYLFSGHACFSVKVFTFESHTAIALEDTLGITRPGGEAPTTLTLECRGKSYDLAFEEDDFEPAASGLEACRRKTMIAVMERKALAEADEAASSRGSMRLEEASGVDGAEADGGGGDGGTPQAPTPQELQPVLELRTEASKGHRALDMALREDDWKAFMRSAVARRYEAEQKVLVEGQPSRALYMVMRGRLRVQLALEEAGSQAVVVNRLEAGQMFGETSLLKRDASEALANATVVADEEEAQLLMMPGAALDELFGANPTLGARFFAYLAATQAERLHKQTRAYMSSDQKLGGRTVGQIQSSLATSLIVSLERVMFREAYRAIYRKYLHSVAVDGESSRVSSRADDGSGDPLTRLRAFDLYVAVSGFKVEPTLVAMHAAAEAILMRFFPEDALVEQSGIFTAAAPSSLDALESFAPLLGGVRGAVRALASRGTTSAARGVFDELQKAALEQLRGEGRHTKHVPTIIRDHGAAYAAFLDSAHYQYILQLKAKEGHVPALDEFKVLRVIGEGAFGQVLEVVKRDCGVAYAMKVMKKRSMEQQLGDKWQAKIAIEQSVMASLHHPFLVNLYYSMQNVDFLVLVMDLVSAGDLADFVLTERRLAAEQVRWVTMELVEVFGYVHSQHIMYRDLKPENVLVDQRGHVRLIDMGLAARFTAVEPRRKSRVGTECYMAPEVRYCKERKERYGVSCDWYTVGVLMYEFTNGDVPYTYKGSDAILRPGTFAGDQTEALCMALLEQDHAKRLGCGKTGAKEVKAHAYFADVDWELVRACTMPSPMVGAKAERIVTGAKSQRDALKMATKLASADERSEVLDADRRAAVSVGTWDFVSPEAVETEYLESVGRCVSAI